MITSNFHRATRSPQTLPAVISPSGPPVPPLHLAKFSFNPRTAISPCSFIIPPLLSHSPLDLHLIGFWPSSVDGRCPHPHPEPTPTPRMQSTSLHYETNSGILNPEKSALFVLGLGGARRAISVYLSALLTLPRPHPRPRPPNPPSAGCSPSPKDPVKVIRSERAIRRSGAKLVDFTSTP